MSQTLKSLKRGPGRPPKKKGGRPRAVTDEIVAKLEHAYSLDCTDLEACLYADIHPTTLYRFQEANPEFRERKQQLKQNPFVLARTTIVSALKENPELALKYMERKKRDEFALRQDVTTNDRPVGVVVYIPDEDQLVKDEQKELESD